MQYSSTEGRKSKYESSSKKINDLFQEFQHLKQRIHLPKPPNLANQSLQDIQSPSKGIKGRKGSFAGTEEKSNSVALVNTSYSEFQIKMSLKKGLQKILTQQMPSFTKNFTQKVNLMENRLGYLYELFQEICKLIKLQKANEASIKSINKCNCQWKGLEVKEVEEKYEKKMKELVVSYETKISLLLKDASNHGTQDSSKNGSIEALKQEIKNIEDELMVKDKELTEAKLQNSRLRRSTDKLNTLLKSKQDLIKELSQEIEDKKKYTQNLELESKHLQEVSSSMKVLQAVNKKISQQKDALEQQNKRLEEQLQAVGKELKEKEEVVRQSLKSLKSKGAEWNQSAIPEKSESLSDFAENDNQILKFDPIDDYQPLRHSHFIHSAEKKSFANEKRIKEIEADLQLLIVENKLLKEKKDRFEEQVKDNEEDEEKFQIQSQIFREELKRVNSTLKNLDECAVMLFYGSKLPWEKVEMLEEDVQLKKQYFKKNSKHRSTSKSSHRK